MTTNKNAAGQKQQQQHHHVLYQTLVNRTRIQLDGYLEDVYALQRRLERQRRMRNGNNNGAAVTARNQELDDAIQDKWNKFRTVYTNMVTDYPSYVGKRIVEIEDMNGYNLLHDVCRRKPPLDIIKLLCLLIDEDSLVSTRSRSPINWAIEYEASHDVVCYLLEKDINQLSLINPWGFHLLFSAAKVGVVFDQEGRCVDITPTLRLIIERTYNILQLKNNKMEDKANLLHAAIKCVHLMKQYAINVIEAVVHMYPEQLRKVDMDGNLPLHMIASCDNSQFHKENGFPWTYSLIKIILHGYPKASEAYNNNNDLPLHVAIKAGKYWEEGLDMIWEANALAATIKDGSDLKFVPFVLAAYIDDPTCVNVSTTSFMLLREFPYLLRGTSS